MLGSSSWTNPRRTRVPAAVTRSPVRHRPLSASSTRSETPGEQLDRLFAQADEMLVNGSRDRTPASTPAGSSPSAHGLSMSGPMPLSSRSASPDLSRRLPTSTQRSRGSSATLPAPPSSTSRSPAEPDRISPLAQRLFATLAESPGVPLDLPQPARVSPVRSTPPAVHAAPILSRTARAELQAYRSPPPGRDRGTW